MNIDAYLALKYGVARATTMTRREARVLGIPYPLQAGWRKIHGQREISEKTAKRLISAMELRHAMARAPKDAAIADDGVASAVEALKQAKWNPRAPAEPESDAFLRSYEWRRVRMQALKLYGARCMACGATPKDGARVHVDHIKPRRLFPALALDVDNLQVLCDECNHGKGNWDMTDWRQEMSAK